MLTVESYVQGGVREDGATFGETYILTIPSFQWKLVSTSIIYCSLQGLTPLDLSGTQSTPKYRSRKRLVVVQYSP
jgi:hypothetical protein